MANFPPFQYQPQIGYGQQMQPLYQAQPYQQPQQAQEQALFCRMATNREEVQAYPVDFSGRPMTFLGPGMQTIWTKVFDPNTGGSIVAEYRRADPAANKTAFVTVSDFEQLIDIVRQQGEDIDRLKAPRRRAPREMEALDDEV